MDRIRRKYGNIFVHLCKKLTRIIEKREKMNNRLFFLRSCKNNDIIPNFINYSCKNVYKLAVNSNSNMPIYHFLKFKRMLLVNQIRGTYSNINKFDDQIKIEVTKIENMLHISELHIFRNWKILRHRNYYNKFNINIKRKLENLFRRKYNGNCYESRVINLTNLEIPDHVARILNLEPKFNPPIGSIGLNEKIFKCIADLEYILPFVRDVNGDREICETEKNGIRYRAANILYNYRFRNNNMSSSSKSLLRDISFVKKYKKEHPEIIFLQSDKSKKSVIMYKSDYDVKMRNLLGDEDTYEMVNNSPLKKLVGEYNVFIKKCYNLEYIDKRELNHLTVSHSNMARIYGTIKDHKVTLDLRPVVSTINYFNSKLSRYLSDILKKIVICDEYIVRNSYDVKERLKDIVIPDNHILVSFDVVSLFTSVSLSLFMSLVEEYWFLIKTHTRMPFETFREALNFCIYKNYFVYDNQIFLQKDGLPMGGSLSPVAASLLIKKLYFSVIEPCKLPFYLQYVDDSLTVLDRNDLEDILAKLNSFNNNIKFTYEIEKDNSINFLDVRIIKNLCGSLSFDVYMKPISSGRFTNFGSNIPFIYKINTIRYFVRRIIKLCDQEFIHDSLNKLRDNAMSNGYPRFLINKIINQVLSKYRNQDLAVAASGSVNPIKQFFPIFYLPGASERISKLFKNYNISIVMKPLNNLRFLYNNKSHFPLSEKSNVIYRIQCEGCREQNRDVFYIGQTKRQVSCRLYEHDYSIRYHKLTTALAQHAENFSHKFNFADCKILYHEDNRVKREFIEKCFIKAYGSKAINFQRDCVGFSSCYDVLFCF